MDFTRIFDGWEERTDFRRPKDLQARVECKDEFLHVQPETLSLLAEEAFHDMAFYLRPSWLEKIAAIDKDEAASENERYLARSLVKNALIAAEGRLPLCQDTGTATLIA